MIVTCPQCERKMQLDEKRVPPGEQVKVKCPHCEHIQNFRSQGAVQPARNSQEGEPRRPPPVMSATNSAAASDIEPDLPRDAFQDFRFPVEQSKTPRNDSMTKGPRIALWVGISLAVIVFFALLVNIVLPGPQGGSIFHTPSQTESSTPNSR